MEKANTKARIDLIAGIIELEGDESFVVKYLDEFKNRINVAPGSGVSQKAVPGKGEVVTPPRKPSGVSEKKKTTTPLKQIRAEAFEVKPQKGETLESFFASKGAPTAHSKRIAVIGYYITQNLSEQYFTEGNIEFAYKVLKLNRPKYVRQACTDAKNQQQYLDNFERADGPSAWVLSRIGEIFVEDEAGSTK